jgi:hypothetical protein
VSELPPKRRPGGRARPGEPKRGTSRGYSWPPFAEGNQLQAVHSGYALASLGPRVDEIAAGLYHALPGAVRHGRFGVAVELAAVALARLETALAALAALGPDDERAERLDRECARWWRASLGSLGALGLTPSSAASLGVDLAELRRAEQRQVALEEGHRLRLAAEQRIARELERSAEG